MDQLIVYFEMRMSHQRKRTAASASAHLESPETHGGDHGTDVVDRSIRAVGEMDNKTIQLTGILPFAEYSMWMVRMLRECTYRVRTMTASRFRFALDWPSDTKTLTVSRTAGCVSTWWALPRLDEGRAPTWSTRDSKCSPSTA
jgi:hypothetical protein